MSESEWIAPVIGITPAIDSRLRRREVKKREPESALALIQNLGDVALAHAVLLEHNAYEHGQKEEDEALAQLLRVKEVVDRAVRDITSTQPQPS